MRKIEPGTDEYTKIISQVKIGKEENELQINGNNGKPDIKFLCNLCGGEKPFFESGCNSPKCTVCGHDNNKGCE